MQRKKKKTMKQTQLETILELSDNIRVIDLPFYSEIFFPSISSFFLNHAIFCLQWEVFHSTISLQHFVTRFQFNLIHDQGANLRMTYQFQPQKQNKKKTVQKKERLRGFPGGAVVENLPANAGDTGSSPGLGRSHMPQSN